MPDFVDSTLWRLSTYERVQDEEGRSGFSAMGSATTLPSTLAAELTRLQRERRSGEVLAVVAACLRQRDSALILLRHCEMVWPLTLFPQQGLYHLTRPSADLFMGGNVDLSVIAVEPPTLRSPGHAMHERIADLPSYRPLPSLLWDLALHAPRPELIDDIGGRAAYRVSANFTPDASAPTGALGAALRRLRAQGASLGDIAHWPGLDRERATRLLNGLYLQGGLMVLRTHPAARGGAGSLENGFTNGITNGITSGLGRLRGWRRPGA